MHAMYKKLKKQNGETFAQTIRNHHNGLLEIEDLDVIVRHAGRDAEPLLPYLMSLLAANDDNTPTTTETDPFVLLEQAGYDAFHADTLEKQNSIKHYFKPHELLCTFNDHARYKSYHIVHAVKKNIDTIKREDFNGHEKRQDAYGTSVISIQMLKNGGFISIKNRYNHSVSGCDHTFNSNPDNIIKGLSAALKERFNVDFSAINDDFPKGFVLINEKIFKYNTEEHNIYYGDQTYALNGNIYTVNRSDGDALFNGFRFDNKTKTLIKIDTERSDSFADDFNRVYGGDSNLHVDKSGNLKLNNDILIGAENSQIKTLYLPGLTTMHNNCLCYTNSLTHFNAPDLKTLGEGCLHHAKSLTYFNAPKLKSMGDDCLYYAYELTHFNALKLRHIANRCLHYVLALKQFDAPYLKTMGRDCLYSADSLTQLNAPKLKTARDYCLHSADSLTYFNAPNLQSVGHNVLHRAKALIHFHAPHLSTIGENCLVHTAALSNPYVPTLQKKYASRLGKASNEPSLY
ncbi:MAG: leucine-rich repeat protein [Pseudomonadota bacterium]|nr:leucine-rich repeat protein [Pseudomonadota bacterium]MEE3322599.1 leucine-rich repeat protein [Pseudomonadota bacterium]